MSQNDTDNVFANKEVILPLVECQKTGSDKVCYFGLYYYFSYYLLHYIQLKGLAAFSLGKVTMNNPAAVSFIFNIIPLLFCLFTFN